VRSIYAAWARGDSSSAEWAHPDIELVVADGPEAGSVIGVVAARDAFRDSLRSWKDWSSEVDEYRELDDARILVLAWSSARGKASGLAIGQKRANLFHLHGGKVTKLILYWDSERALADLGPASERDAADSDLPD
jgi:ketosteroid isomerase-like protein